MEALKDQYIEEMKECMSTIGSKRFPKEQVLRRMFEIYKIFNPRDNPCFTCRGARANVYQWFELKLTKWQIGK